MARPENGPPDLRVAVPTLEPDEAFLARLSERAAGSGESHPPAGAAAPAGWRVGLAAVSVAAVVAGIAWLAGAVPGEGVPTPPPTPVTNPTDPQAPEPSPEQDQPESAGSAPADTGPSGAGSSGRPGSPDQAQHGQGQQDPGNRGGGERGPGNAPELPVQADAGMGTGMGTGMGMGRGRGDELGPDHGQGGDTRTVGEG